MASSYGRNFCGDHLQCCGLLHVLAQHLGLFMRVAELPMLGFLGGRKACVHTAIIVIGFDMGLGINLFLRWLAGLKVIPASSTKSTITTPLPGPPRPKDEMPLRVVAGLSKADVVRLKLV